MKLIRILLAAVLLLSMLLPLASCEPAAEEPVVSVETKTEEEVNAEEGNDMPLTEFTALEMKDSIKLLGGRTGYNADGELVAEWSGSGFEANIKVNKEGTDLRMGLRANYAARWMIYVDGEAWGERVATSTGNRKTIIAKGIPAGEHTIRIVKDSQPGTNRNNYNSILSFAFNGEFMAPPAEKDLYLEFIGDGYMVGFGALGKGSNSSNTKIVDETSFTVALPYLTAEAMDADYCIAAHSEIGFKKKAGAYAMAGLYANQFAYRDLTNRYKPTRTPDAIVIHVGMEDTLSSIPMGEFMVTGENFIKTVRAYYGKDVPVVWLYNTVYHTVRAGEIDALAKMMGGADAGVYALAVHYDANGSGTSGSTRHSSPEGHQKSTEILVDFLKDIVK